MKRVVRGLVACSPYLLALGGFTLVVMVTYWRLWTWLPSERRIFGWDCLEYYFPDLAFQYGSITRGQWPLWNPFQQGGYPYTGESHAGLYYPLNWLVLLLACLLHGVPEGLIHVYALGHLVLGSFFMFLYARSRRAPWGGAFLAGIVYSLAGYIAFSKDLGLWNLAWLPLIMLCLDRIVDQPTRARGAQLGTAVGMAALSAPPPSFFYILLFTGPYLLLRLIERLRGEPAAARPLLLSFAVAAATCVGLAAVLYVPVIELVSFSERSSLPLSWATIGSMGPPNVLGIVLPGVMRGGAIYVGALPFLLCAAALLLPPSWDRRAPALIALTGLLALLLALGSNGTVLERLAALIPGFSMFRVAQRYTLLFNAAAACLTAYGAAVLHSDRPERSGPLRGLLVGAYFYLGLVLFGLMVTLGPNASALLANGLRGMMRLDGLGLGLLAGVMATALIGPLLWYGRRPTAKWWLLAICFTLPDLWTGQAELYDIYEKPRDFSLDRDVALLPGVDREWRVLDEHRFGQRPGSRLRIRDFLDYYVAPLAQQRWVNVIEMAHDDPGLLRHFNVRWLLRWPHHRRGATYYLAHDDTRAAYKPRPGNQAWILEAADAVPALMWYGAVEWVPPGEDALRWLHRTRPGDHVLLEAADMKEAERARLMALRVGPGMRTAMTGRVLELTDNQVRTEVDAPAEGVVVSNEVWYPGWEALVDGRPARVFRVNYLLRGVLVGAGHHRIDWRFHPLAIRLCLPLYLLTLLSLLSWCLLAAARAVRH